jgi:hypothetical protein
VVCICLSHIVADKMAAPSGLYMSNTVSYEHKSAFNVPGKMVASKGLHLFVKYCFSQDGVCGLHLFVTYVLLQARWRRHVVCICLSNITHIIEGKMAARRGLHLLVTYCCRQDGGATWSVFDSYILLKARWWRHVVFTCLLHIAVGKMAAPRDLYLFVTYCCRQDGGAT